MLAPDTILQNRYRIVRPLGQGGMGTVYEAVDGRLDTIVALKETNFTDERLGKQFEREARLLARLRHPALTRVIDHFKESDGQFLVMDYIAGEDLGEIAQRREHAFLQEEVLLWGDQLLDALNYLHSQDPPIIHRDIKPQNLKLSETGQVILLDFGLAKGFAGQVSRVTTSGSIFGYTPNYAPLEQIHGTGTDERSDLYSLAATLYHLITGKVPPDALSRALAMASEQPDPLRPANEINSSVSAAVAGVLHLAMATNPAKRPRTAGEMREMLKQAAGDRRLEETMLPPDVLSEAPTLHAVEVEPATSGITFKPDNVHQPAQTIASPTALPPKLPLEEAATNISEPEIAYSEKNSGRLWLLISGLVLVLLLGSIIYLTRDNSTLKDSSLSGVGLKPSGSSNVQEFTLHQDVPLLARPSFAYSQVGLAESGSRVQLLSVDGDWNEILVLEHGRSKENQGSQDRGWFNKKMYPEALK